MPRPRAPRNPPSFPSLNRTAEFRRVPLNLDVAARNYTTEHRDKARERVIDEQFVIRRQAGSRAAFDLLLLRRWRRRLRQRIFELAKHE